MHPDKPFILLHLLKLSGLRCCHRKFIKDMLQNRDIAKFGIRAVCSKADGIAVLGGELLRLLCLFCA